MRTRDEELSVNWGTICTPNHTAHIKIIIN